MLISSDKYLLSEGELAPRRHFPARAPALMRFWYAFYYGAGAVIPVSNLS